MNRDRLHPDEIHDLVVTGPRSLNEHTWLDSQIDRALRHAVTAALAALLIGALVWCALAMAPALLDALDSGPYCPGSDPAWLGWCSDAPMMEGW